jgi:hypothetical protein
MTGLVAYFRFGISRQISIAKKLYIYQDLAIEKGGGIEVIWRFFLIWFGVLSFY